MQADRNKFKLTEDPPCLQSHSLLQEFMTYIRETKVVILEDLAAHFKLNTQVSKFSLFFSYPISSLFRLQLLLLTFHYS